MAKADMVIPIGGDSPELYTIVNKEEYISLKILEEKYRRMDDANFLHSDAYQFAVNPAGSPSMEDFEIELRALLWL